MPIQRTRRHCTMSVARPSHMDMTLAKQSPWSSPDPGFVNFVTELGFKLSDDGLRDALAPRLK